MEQEETMTFSKPLPDDVFSVAEKVTIWLVIAAVVSLTFALALAYDSVWTQTLQPIIWDPVVKDAGVAGDAGYSLQNTSLYTMTLLVCVILLQALFRKWRLSTDETMTLALIAWVCVAPVLRVLEDADFFSSSQDVLFISPIIHLHLALWVISIAILSHIVASGLDGHHSDAAEETRKTRLFGTLFLAIFLHWYLLYAPAYSAHDTIEFTWGRIGLVASCAMIWTVLNLTRDWLAMPRGMMAFASGAIVLGLAHWAQFIATPWAQESGRMSGEITIWPVFIVIGLPALVCFALYRYGVEDALQLKLTGYRAGVLPAEISIKQWEAEQEKWKGHPVEFLSNKALLAHPMVLGMVFGQLCDGFATMVGIDFFGYGEKHPVSNGVIQYGASINETLGISWGEGAWLFALVKATLVGIIVWLFIQMRVEQRQQHFRLLVVLAVFIVGLAPGLRDIGRLMLGV